MSEWLTSGTEDDMRERMFVVADLGEDYALATIVAADGGPRPVGSQMVITQTESWGFLSGGCIEADVVLHGRQVLNSGNPQQLVYGEGSPFIDIRLPCGGRLDILVERVSQDDAAVKRLRKLTIERQSALFYSDGRTRHCTEAANASPCPPEGYSRIYEPLRQLVVIGSDPFALAMAGLGQRIGWSTVLLAPFGSSATPPFGIDVDRRPLDVSLREVALDRYTAVAVATHELGHDVAALVPALTSMAGYVGVLGSRRKRDERRAALIGAGVPSADIERLHSPIGLPIGGKNPWEIAIAVLGEIVAEMRSIDAVRETARAPLHAVG